MTNTQQPSQGPGLDLNGILYIIYRHKWKVLFFTLVGVGAAAAYYFSVPPSYASEAKILVRYVLDRNPIDGVENRSNTSPDVESGESVIGSEIEIMTSWDLALEVADAIGPDKLAPKIPGESGRAAAAQAVSNGLVVTPERGTNVIVLSYSNHDPELATQVLDKLIDRYLHAHLTIHSGLNSFDLAEARTDQVQAQLQVIVNELRKLKSQTGITSVADSIASNNAGMSKVQDELSAAEADEADQQASVKEMEKLLADRNPLQPKVDIVNASPTPKPVDTSVVDHYQAVVNRLAELRKDELDKLLYYTSESTVVKSIDDQISSLDQERRGLEQKYPSLANSTVAKADGADPMAADLDTEQVRLAATVARVNAFQKQLQDLQVRAAHLADVGGQITALERQEAILEGNAGYSQDNLEKARLDEDLDPSKMSNIYPIQRPSAAVLEQAKRGKAVLGLAGGGLGLGILIAFLIELVFDRSIKRPLEYESRLQIPLFLSIPFSQKLATSHPALGTGEPPAEGGGDSGKAIQKADQPKAAPWETSHFIRPYAEAIRDRLILSFQLKNLTHKPKLVGVTGLVGGEGTSTLAASLAAALSETGDGKVLLVDMNPGSSLAHPFFDGKPALGLSDALEANGTLRPAAENLYFATGTAENNGPMQLPPKKFYDLMPNIKASHFDYVIFDLPPIARSSMTLAISGCLDSLLLVAEAEKSDRNDLKRTYKDFVAAKADVACVLNKTRVTGPKWLVN